ncbi:MAG: Fe-S cluster assembly ATPase SufC [Acidimicrobiaceae bacterium]|nr:Fe-S cluster assembly ATPase SufC [Acidimicrobiaceae bacterium]MCY4280452.1 Fe-S cluster assembly ATPase SufC [Acidimicrobiaceae bacterium]MCY4295219.1 Fe-S cluster assembly ATPase SufC [Acidimicrobiaceae bacterium]
MSTLTIEGLHASVAGREILSGVDLEVAAGEVHAVMGPNGSGKSTLAHVIAGRSGYEELSGSVRLDGCELLGMPAWKRAEAGLFLAMQYPTEVPGVSLLDMLTESVRTPEGAAVQEQMLGEADRIGLEAQFLQRPVNVDLSGGERKRNEALQLGVLKPAFAVMDELDSGLDVDALRIVAGRIEEATEHDGLGVLAITHYSRIFAHLRPDAVHVFAGGRIQESGGAELADELEADGYERWTAALTPASGDTSTSSGSQAFTDPFGDPFADQLV